MMRSLFSGVSGLKAHQQKMDVIGNNIANVNTVAYKASRVTFSDILSQTISSATGSNSTTGRGGSNAKQVGLGTQVASIDMLMTTGSTESTGNTTDLAIDGSGFFIVRNGTTGSYMFTRAGNFTVDENGNLTTSDGMNVYGWLEYEVDESDGSYIFDTDKDVELINIYSDSYNGSKKNVSAKATSYATFTGSINSSEEPLGSAADNINSTDPEVQYSTTMTVYDSLGNTHELTVNFTKCYVDTSGTSPVTTWYWSIEGDSGASVSTASGYLKFNSDGELVTDDTDTDFDATPTITVVPGSSTGAGSFTVDIDFSDITTTADDSSVETSDVDGYAAGTLEDISIDSDGIIMGVYSNGVEQPLGMVALAQFDNAAGLERVGSNYYVVTSNSGDFTGGVASNGSLSSGTLEMSNVDLSTEFAQMITTQRGYQANSRIITTADEMLQTVIDMIR